MGVLVTPCPPPHNIGDYLSLSTVSHATLTGVDLHEPKGVGTAANGTVYIANGSGSGAWGSVAASLNFVGMIADFALPTAPIGWLECDGTAVSRTTYADLWAASTIQQSGTRSSGSPTITGLSSTTNMKVGYYVGGAGIGIGTTILSVDSSSQITLSANAVSSGTATVVVSQYPQGDGSTNFNLPDTKTNGRYRRSRSSSVQAGTLQADSIASHTHSLTTDGGHTHTATDAGHTHSDGILTLSGTFSVSSPGGLTYPISGSSTTGLGYASITVGSSGSHTHTVGNTGSTETRPISIAVLTCIKY